MTTLPEGRFFDFPLTSCTATPKIPALISADEIENLTEIPRQIKSALSTLGNRASGIYCLGDRIRVYILADSDEKYPLLPQDFDIPGLLKRTADELIANSSGESPSIHAKVLTSQLFVGLLRAVATKKPGTHAAPTFNDASGAHPIPVLSPTAFVQPTTRRDRSMSATMRVLGCLYSKQSGLRYLLTDEGLEVGFTPDLEASMAALPISAIRDGLWFTGTIFQDDRDQWVTMPSGKIVQQAAM